MSSQSAVFRAANMGETFKIQSLIEKGENVNWADSKGFSCLHAAVNGGYTDCVEVLVKGKANVNAKDRDGTTPLHLAATLNNLDMVKLLISNGANVNAEDNKGTPLHRSAEGNNSDGNDAVSFGDSGGNLIGVTEALLKAGTKVNEKNRSGKDEILDSLKQFQGRTALHIAVQKEDVALVKILLSYGANPKDKDNVGMTPLEFASNKPAIKKLLETPPPKSS